MSMDLFFRPQQISSKLQYLMDQKSLLGYEILKKKEKRKKAFF